MVSDPLREHAVAAALESFDPGALLGGRLEHGELTLEIAPEKIAATCGFLKHTLKFARLSTITGVDRYPAEPRFEVVYHLYSVQSRQRLRLKCRLAGAAPEIDSVTCVWRGADWYERETFDLFGIRFRNHPDPRRILLPEDWQGHPLRKDYPKTGERYQP